MWVIRNTSLSFSTKQLSPDAPPDASSDYYHYLVARIIKAISFRLDLTGLSTEPKLIIKTMSADKPNPLLDWQHETYKAYDINKSLKKHLEWRGFAQH